ncbi:hypothetical protein BYT27DRAFT_7163905 [Phlegmacium glaucopus]|nr:hypothetical protein BYT27DRAFT_7163905 [Phlegmacium glaucopus]
MTQPTGNAKLSSLTQWSQEHIQAIFESPSKEESIQEVDETFASNLKLEATLNGKKIGQAEIKQLVLSMRAESPSGLRVEWKQTVEVPQDAYNRNGSFGGFYIIHNIHRTIAGHDNPVKFERHKAVTVIIESQSPDTTIDSRKIVNLVFVASDKRVNGGDPTEARVPNALEENLCDLNCQ